MRLAFRIARRDALQSPGRTALIVALVAIPVIGLTGLATVVGSTLSTADETVSAQLGQTQARITMVSPPDKTLVQSPDNPEYFASNDGITLGDNPQILTPASFLPGARMISVRQTSVTAKTAGGIGSLLASEGTPWDPSLAGHYDLLSGRRPASPTEILASPAALVRLGVSVGGTISTELPRALSFTIVGTLEDHTQPADTQVIYGEPGAFDGVTPDADLAGTVFYLPSTKVEWEKVRRLNTFGATVLSRDVLLNPPPASQTPIPAQGNQIPWSSLSLAFPLAGFALFEVALLAGAAFAVGARKQQKSLATLASVGGDRRMLFRVIAFGGIILGTIGGIIGAGLGVAGAAIFVRFASDGSTTQYPGFHPNAFVLIGVSAFAALAGLLSAAIPARAASKVDVVTALRGSSRPKVVTARRSIVGVVLACAGGVLTLVGGAIALVPQTQGEINETPIVLGLSLVVAGPILEQIGAILIAPLILKWISSLFSGFGLGARLGSRDAARNSARSVPALAAIMTTVFVGSFVMTYNASSEAQETATWDYWTTPNVAQADLTGWLPGGKPATAADVDKAATVIKSTFNVAITQTLSASPLPVQGGTDETESSALFPGPVLEKSKVCPDGIWSRFTNGASNGGPCDLAPYTIKQQIWVGTASDLSAALGVAASATSKATLAAGGAVSLYPEYVHDGRATIGWNTGAQLAAESAKPVDLPPVRSVSVPASIQLPVHGYHFTIFISPETASKLGIAFSPSLVLAKVGAPATDAQYDSLNAAAAVLTGGGADSTPLLFRVEPGPPHAAGGWAWILLVICAIIVLGAASVAIGLARADGRRDEYVLGASGASPGVRRWFGFWQAICLAGTGAIIGVLLGVLPALALSIPNAGTGTAGLLFAPPVAQLALAGLGVPIAIAVGSWVTTRGARKSFASDGLARS